MDHAHATALLEGISRQPIVEMLIPFTIDATLAPKGAHVASLFCQYFSYTLRGGRGWHQEKQRAIVSSSRRSIRTHQTFARVSPDTRP